MFFPSVRAWHLQWCMRALLMLMCLSPSAFAAQSGAPLTYAEAIRRVLQNNPELQVFAWHHRALQGEVMSADRSAGYHLEFDAENIRQSSDDLEVTLAISSVLELGNKRGARVAIAESRLSLVESEREAAALDLLAQVTQRFVSVLSLQEKLKVVDEATELARISHRLVRQRFESGAVPEADVLRAEAASVRAQLRQQALAAQLASQKLSLATQWGARDIDFGHVDGALFHFVDVADFNELYRRAVASPALRVFADEARVRQAEIDLAMSRSRADIQWRAGVRHFAGADQSALVAGISIPLASAKRSGGDIQAATAERQLVDNRREIALLSLRSTLFDAWQTRQQAAHQVAQLNQRVLPILARALEQTRQAYERGRYSYVEWANIQQDFLDAKLALVDAATDTLMQQALIEQLTAEPLAAHSPPESNQD